jgi:hypothetical protein
MLDERDPYVKFKLEMLKRAMPAESAIVFGDIYRVDGAYTKKCLDHGCRQVLLVDTLETARWQETRIQFPTLEFYKGDFSNPFFMRSFVRTFDVGVVYDILLHQAAIVHTLHLMLEKVGRRLCIVQPMLREQSIPNSLIYLPGNPNRELYPKRENSDQFLQFDVHQVNHSHWLWGITVSFLTSVLKGEGFELVHQSECQDHSLTEQWILWGGVAERTEPNPAHWSVVQPSNGLHSPLW